MMIASLNEVEVTIRKAGVGAGLPHGVAVETGRAAAWLAGAGLPAFDICEPALSALLNGETSVGTARREGCGWSIEPAATGLLCPCYGGVAAADLLNAGASPIRIVDTMSPVLVIALLVVIGDAPPVFVFTKSESEPAATNLIEVHGGTVRTAAGVRFDQGLAAPANMQISVSAEPDAAQPGMAYGTGGSLERALGEGTPVDPRIWERIEALAARTLVPASDVSRERGAGAGRIDSD